MWGFFARRPLLYALTTKLAVRVLERLGGSGGMLRRLPMMGGWMDTRDMPTPTGRTFRELYAASQSHLG